MERSLSPKILQLEHQRFNVTRKFVLSFLFKLTKECLIKSQNQPTCICQLSWLFSRACRVLLSPARHWKVVKVWRQILHSLTSFCHSHCCCWPVMMKRYNIYEHSVSMYKSPAIFFFFFFRRWALLAVLLRWVGLLWVTGRFWGFRTISEKNLCLKESCVSKKSVSHRNICLKEICVSKKSVSQRKLCL